MPTVQGATLADLCREVSVEPTLGAVPPVMKCRLCCDYWVDERSCKRSHPGTNDLLILAVCLELLKKCQLYLIEVILDSVIRSQGPMTEGLA